MKSRGRCFVEVDADSNIIRIFKNQGLACASDSFDLGRVFEYPRKYAVEFIRKQVLLRANYKCEHCGSRVLWNTAHMDERIPKGNGGEVSLDNCRCLCADCHIGDNGCSSHSNRFWGGGKDLKFDD